MIQRMIQRLKRLFAKQVDGQGLVEYGLIMGLIAVVAIAALNSTGDNTRRMVQKVAASLSSVATGVAGGGGGGNGGGGGGGS